MFVLHPEIDNTPGMGPKPQPKANAQPPPLTSDCRKCQASNAEQQPAKRTRRGVNNDNDNDEVRDDEDLGQWAEIEEQAILKGRGKGGNQGNQGKGGLKFGPPGRYV